MLVIPSWPGKDTCDGITRREILRVGGSATLGISLADIFSLQKASAASNQSGGGRLYHARLQKAFSSSSSVKSAAFKVKSN